MSKVVICPRHNCMWDTIETGFINEYGTYFCQMIKYLKEHGNVPPRLLWPFLQTIKKTKDCNFDVYRGIIAQMQQVLFCLDIQNTLDIFNSFNSPGWDNIKTKLSDMAHGAELFLEHGSRAERMPFLQACRTAAETIGVMEIDQFMKGFGVSHDKLAHEFLTIRRLFDHAVYDDGENGMVLSDSLDRLWWSLCGSWCYHELSGLCEVDPSL